MAESKYTKNAIKKHEEDIKLLKAVEKLKELKKIKPRGFRKPRNKYNKIWQKIKNRL